MTRRRRATRRSVRRRTPQRNASGRFVKRRTAARKTAAPTRRRRRAPARRRSAPKRRAAPKRRRSSAMTIAAAPRRRRRRRASTALAAAPRRRRRRRSSSAALAAPPARRRRRRRSSSTALYMDRQNHAPARRRRRRRARQNPPTPRQHRRAIKRAARNPARARGRYQAIRATKTVTLRDRKTGRRLIVRRTRVYANPRTSWGEIAYMGGGLIFGGIVSDILDRVVATRQPDGGNNPRYAVDAANAILTRPDGIRIGAQIALIIGSFLLAGRMSKGKAGNAGNALVGVGFGAIARTGVQIWNGWIAPMLWPVAKGDEMDISNRLYSWEQPWNQAWLEANNIAQGKPTAPGQSGKDGKLPAEFITNTAAPASSTTSGPPAGRQPGRIEGDAANGRKRLEGAQTSQVSGASGTTGGCGCGGKCGGSGGCKKNAGDIICTCPECADAIRQGFVPPHAPGYGGSDTTTRVEEVPVTVPLRSPMLLPAEVVRETSDNIERVRTGSRDRADSMTRADLVSRAQLGEPSHASRLLPPSPVVSPLGARSERYTVSLRG